MESQPQNPEFKITEMRTGGFFKKEEFLSKKREPLYQGG